LLRRALTDGRLKDGLDTIIPLCTGSKDNVDKSELKKKDKEGLKTDDEVKIIDKIPPKSENGIVGDLKLIDYGDNVYRNFVRSSMGDKNGHLMGYRIRQTGRITNNGSGASLSNFSMDPSACTDWSALSGLYDEFRVLMVTLQITLIDHLTNSGYIGIAYDNDNVFNPTSMNDVVQYENFKFHDMWKMLKFTAKRPDITKDAYWVDVGNPSSSAGCVPYVYSNGLISGVSLAWVMTYHIDFRGKL